MSNWYLSARTVIFLTSEAVGGARVGCRPVLLVLLDICSRRDRALTGNREEHDDREQSGALWRVHVSTTAHV